MRTALLSALTSLCCSQIWYMGFVLWLLSLLRAFKVKERNPLRPSIQWAQLNVQCVRTSKVSITRVSRRKAGTHKAKAKDAGFRCIFIYLGKP